MVTTIQISEGAKGILGKMKKGNETYEGVIMNLINSVETHKRNQKELLIEGYKEMAEESLKIAKEFEAIEEDFDWEW